MAVLAAMVAAAVPAQAALAGSAGQVECGIYEYVAADAVTPGSIEFGGNTQLGLHGDKFVIAPGATVPDHVGEFPGAPSCLSLTLDAGQITHMEYAPTGTVSGPVVLHGDPVNDPWAFYMTAGRVLSPVPAVDSEPGLWAILGNAVLTDRTVTLTFQINTEFGVPTSFTASTILRGPVVADGDDFDVDHGTLPDEVINPSKRSVLEGLASAGKSAKVRITSEGTIDVNTGVVSVTTQLQIQAKAADTATGAVEGPCGGSAYYGVFDNSNGSQSTRFRVKWKTNYGIHTVSKWVPAGFVFRTVKHWARPGTLVKVSYKHPVTHKWVPLDWERSVKGSFPLCAYQRGFELPPI